MTIVRILLIFTVALYSTKIQAQRSIIYYELITVDSVALFFNKNFMFTEKECYDYVRQVRITENGDFNGYFEDRSVEGRLLAKGVYIKGIKHGYFEVYHANGKLFSRGYYSNNKPIGIWEYFHSSGLPERILDISDSATLVVRYLEETGKVRIDKGSGLFDGLVAGLPGSRKEPLLRYTITGIHATGRIKDGKPDGRWVVPDHNHQAVYVEKFNQGELIKSTVFSKRKMKNFQQLSMLNTFFLSNHLEALEFYERESCSESQQYFFNKYPSDFKAFSFDLRQKMNYIIDTDLRSARKDYYAIGENFMSLQFLVDEKGRPYDIKLVSEWGENFLKIAENTLKKTVFTTNSKTMYFHLKVSYAGGYVYKYNFRFSKRDRIP